MSYSQQTVVKLKRATPLGSTKKHLSFDIPPNAAAITLKDSDKEDLIDFVKAFANRIACGGIPVTHLTCANPRRLPLQWDHSEAVLVMDEYMTSLSIHSQGPLKIPYLGVYFISQIIVGDSLLSETRGLSQFPKSLLKRMMMLRFREQPIHELLFICQSSDDLQQITAALSLFRLVPRHDAAQRLQAQIRRALVQRVSRSSPEPSLGPYSHDLKFRTSDDVSTQIEQSGTSSTITNPPTESTSPLVKVPSLETPRIRRRPSLSAVESVPDVSVIQLPSPSPKLTLFSPSIRSSFFTEPPATQNLIKAINEVSSPRQQEKIASFSEVSTLNSRGVESDFSPRAEWCCSPVRTSDPIGATVDDERSPVYNKKSAESQGHASSPRRLISKGDVSPSSPNALPSLILPVNGYVTVLKRHKQREVRLTDYQVRIRDAHRQPFATEVKDDVHHDSGAKRQEELANPTLWTPPSSAKMYTAAKTNMIYLDDAGEVHTESTTGSRSIASGVVRVDLRSCGSRKRDTQLAEVLYIPEEKVKKGTWQEVLQSPSPPTTNKTDKVVLSRIVKEREASDQGGNSIKLEVLDSAISPLVKQRQKTETSINLSDLNYNAQLAVPLMRQHDASRPDQEQRSPRTLLSPRDDFQPMRECRTQKSPRSEHGSRITRRDTGTNDFTALFNKTELTESSWMPNISEGGEGTMTLLMAEQIDTMPGNHELNLARPDLVIDDDAFSVSASQLGPRPRRQNSRLRLLSPLREDSGWQHQNTVRGQLSPLEKLKRAGHGLPTPFAQAAALRRSAEVPVPTLSARLHYSNA